MIFSQRIGLRLKKRDYESFGWKFVGGNNIGILVKEIENWKSAYNAEIEVGWKLLEVSFLYRIIHQKGFITNSCSSLF